MAPRPLLRRVVAAVLGVLLLAPATPEHRPSGADAADLIALTAGCPAGAEDGFTDVGVTNVHEPAVDCIVHWGVARGAGDTYRPAQLVDRGQMASFIAGVLTATGATLPASPPDAFVDDGDSVHEASIDRLAALGIVSGRTATRFEPAAAVTRGQMATFLVRALEARTGTTATADGTTFTDTVGDVHAAAIQAVGSLGIASGVAPGVYGSDRAVRRDQMASFVARLLGRLVEDGVATIPTAPATDRDPTPSAAPAPTATAPYVFTTTTDEGDPVRYDPCSPLPVVVNYAGSHRSAREAVPAAIASLEQVLGVDIVLEGETTERLTRPGDEREILQVDRYGRRWAPILINWPVDYDRTDSRGLGGSRYFLGDGFDHAYVTGTVSVNGGMAMDRATLQRVVMHELGHVVGLGHVDDPSEIMYPGGTGTTWGDGDRAGLRVLGPTSGCLDPVTPEEVGWL